MIPPPPGPPDRDPGAPHPPNEPAAPDATASGANVPYDGRERRADGPDANGVAADAELARRYAGHLALLRRVSTQLPHTATPAEVAAVMVDALAEAYGAAWVALYRANPDGTFSRTTLHGRGADLAATHGGPPSRVAGPAVTSLYFAPDAPVARAAAAGAREPGAPHADDAAAVVLGAELVAPVDDASGRLGWFAVGPRLRGAVAGDAAGGGAEALAYDEADRRFLALLSHFAAPRIAHADLAAAYRHASLMDDVTGVGNRRAFEERLEEELARSNRSGQPVALILCELRDFDDYAARHGGAARDRTLRAVAAAAVQSVRRSDSVFRHGSARIALVLTNTDAAGARIAADRISRSVAMLAPPDAAEPIACSLGIGALRGVHKPLSLATLALYKKADEALHRAMRA